MGRALLVVLVSWTCGCYRSHARSEDAAPPPIDAGAPCEFSFRRTDGADVRCAISVSSVEACTEAAVCICAAGEPTTSVEVLRCAGWDLTPRGAPTFTDYCPLDPPARMTMAEALEGHLGDVTVSEACRGVPALIGPRPYDGCAMLAEVLCPCAPEPCDLDALLGRSCLSLTRDQVGCVRDRLPPNSSCTADARAAVRECGG